MLSQDVIPSLHVGGEARKEPGVHTESLLQSSWKRRLVKQ
jgi:hypothetical protein